MKKNWKPTRRGLFGAAALPLVAQESSNPAQTVPAQTELIRRGVAANVAALKKYKLDMATEPAFTFKA
ncbi:MAG: hypothetical protein NW208_15240 [Bryobacter sp.]|nr:hypothetical protein [Bryobacter sp.]